MNISTMILAAGTCLAGLGMMIAVATAPVITTDPANSILTGTRNAGHMMLAGDDWEARV